MDRLTSPAFRAMLTPQLVKVSDLFKANQYELRAAGGAVRDLLMNKVPADVDLATTATPEQMKSMFTAADVRMIDLGAAERHGTITVRIDDKENFEITTLRIDHNHDGRWADVQWTTDWETDANRRDLTINAMFLDLEGNLYDYFGGMSDLREQRIRFVGDPSMRIQEDFLRILRYFRFYGRIAQQPNAFEGIQLEAIRRNADGLQGISGERIWAELRKILTGNHVPSIVEQLRELGVVSYIGLPDAIDAANFSAVWIRSRDMKPKAVTLLAAMLHSVEQVQAFHARVRLSNEERFLAHSIIHYRDRIRPLMAQASDPIIPFKCIAVDQSALARTPSESMLHATEMLKYLGERTLLRRIESIEIPAFPVDGFELHARGVVLGPMMGQCLAQLKTAWLRSEFRLSSDELLDNHLPAIIASLPKHVTVKRGKRLRPNQQQQEASRSKAGRSPVLDQYFGATDN